MYEYKEVYSSGTYLKIASQIKIWNAGNLDQKDKSIQT
jgi:hypothetical protein